MPGESDTATRRRVGRPAQITRTQVVDAAVKVGLDQMSMVSVAAVLGVKHSTLYNHVANRDELLALTTDRLFETAPWPQPGGAETWREDATEFAVCLWRLMRDNPGLSTELARRHTKPIAFDDLCPRYWDAIRSLRSIILQGGLSRIDTIALADVVLEVTYTHGSTGWRSDNHDTTKLKGVDPSIAPALAEMLSMPPEQVLRRKLSLVLRPAAK